MRTLIFSCLLGGALSAQIGGPLIGYVPDGAHIRPIYGLPAAGAFGAPLDAGRDFALTAIAPTQNFALVTAADTGELMVYKPVLRPDHRQRCSDQSRHARHQPLRILRRALVPSDRQTANRQRPSRFARRPHHRRLVP